MAPGPTQPVVRITGEEIAPNSVDAPALRAAAKAFYRKTLSGTTVTNPTLGVVRFSGRGLDKAISTSADTYKLRLFVVLPDIIKGGEVVGFRENTKPGAKAGVLRYHAIEALVEVGGQPSRVRC